MAYALGGWDPLHLPLLPHRLLLTNHQVHQALRRGDAHYPASKIDFWNNFLHKRDEAGALITLQLYPEGVMGACACMQASTCLRIVLAAAGGATDMIKLADDFPTLKKGWGTCAFVDIHNCANGAL